MNCRILSGTLFILWIIPYFTSSESPGVPACDSQIYCDGPLLDTIQKANLYNDSKTFVDKSLKNSSDVVLRAFKALPANSTKEQLESFMNDYFSGPAEEFEDWDPQDYVEDPDFLERVKDGELRSFGKSLCRIWKHLGRKIKPDVKLHPDRYSLIYLPNPFIIPGGRFREIYYWDSYWVVQGLLRCEMKETVKGMLENMITLVEKVGFVPNGGRIYYTRRSQPPFLIPMVNSYFEATQDKDFLLDNIDMLEKEYSFWENNRTVEISREGVAYNLSRYATIISKPRPESYREDLETAKDIKSPEDRQEMFSNLASAAESGWDFSSRWFALDNESDLALNTTKTKDIIPVDLNSILCLNEKLLAKFYGKLGNSTKQAEYTEKSRIRQNAIKKILWNDKDGVWLDHSIMHNRSRDHFYVSNVFPWFAGCHGDSANERRQVESKVVRYLQSQDVLSYVGGIPTSRIQTGQQWDFPNAWPPLQHVLISALASGSHFSSQELARSLASKWIYDNWKGWKRTKHMFEKYVVTKVGSRGSGGEYDVQEGFGWTNGVVLDLLDKYGDVLSVQEKSKCATSGSNSCSHGICMWLVMGLLLLLRKVDMQLLCVAI